MKIAVTRKQKPSDMTLTNRIEPDISLADPASADSRRKLILLILLLTSFVIPSCNRPPAEINGIWQGAVYLSRNEGDEVPFSIELKQEGGKVTGALVNGDERLTSTDGSWDGKNLKLRFDYYDGELNAALIRREMIGEFTRQWQKQKLKRPVKFWRTRQDFNPPASDSRTVSGEWLLRVGEGEKQKVWRAEFKQKGAAVTGTLIPPSGDWGVMTGNCYDGRLMLSRFDGINAHNFKAVLTDQDTLEGIVDFGLPDSRTRKIIGEKVAATSATSASALPDPNSITKVKNPTEPFRFIFPDLAGKTVSLADPQFKNKVVIASITGSWCPNCHDEVKVLNDLYDRYHAQGLEIIALAFEYTGDAARDREQVRKAFVVRHGVRFPLLLAGSTADGEVEQKLPQLTGFGAFPTTIFIGRDGLVKRIHAGFEGPATGDRYPKLKAEIDNLVKELLAGTEK